MLVERVGCLAAARSFCVQEGCSWSACRVERPLLRLFAIPSFLCDDFLKALGDG